MLEATICLSSAENESGTGRVPDLSSLSIEQWAAILGVAAFCAFTLLVKRYGTKQQSTVFSVVSVLMALGLLAGLALKGSTGN